MRYPFFYLAVAGIMLVIGFVTTGCTNDASINPEKVWQVAFTFGEAEHMWEGWDKPSDDGPSLHITTNGSLVGGEYVSYGIGNTTRACEYANCLTMCVTHVTSNADLIYALTSGDSEQKFGALETLLAPGVREFDCTLPTYTTVAVYWTLEDAWWSHAEAELNNYEIIRAERYEHSVYGKVMAVDARFSLTLVNPIRDHAAQELNGTSRTYYKTRN